MVADLPDVSLDRVLGRTRTCGECMEWAGYAIGGRIPQIRVEMKCYPVKRLVYQLVHGPVPSEKFIGNSRQCRNPLCVNPDHLVSRTRSQALKGSARTVGHKAKIANGRRQGSILTMEDARAIRLSDESNPVVAKRFGISANYVSSIRRGVTWKEYSSPFQGLGAR